MNRLHHNESVYEIFELCELYVYSEVPTTRWANGFQLYGLTRVTENDPIFDWNIFSVGKCNLWRKKILSEIEEAPRYNLLLCCLQCLHSLRCLYCIVFTASTAHTVSSFYTIGTTLHCLNSNMHAYIWVILRCWGNLSMVCQQNSDAL